jgi:hypothetical protein
MKKSIITLISIVMMLTSSLKSQDSFTLRLDETQTLQEMLDILVNSRALNYGEWDPDPSVNDYFIKINSGTVNLNGFDNSINLSLGATAYAEFNIGWDNFGFSYSKDMTIDVSGTPAIENDPVTGLSNVVLNDVSVVIAVNIWPDWLPIEFIVRMNLEDRFEDLSFINLVEFYPDINPYYFQSSIPEISVTNDAILISIQLNQELEIANKSNSNPLSYLNGSLSLQNFNTPVLTQSNKSSPSLVFARLNDNYKATTHDHTIGGEVHLTWTNNIDHKLTTDLFQLQQIYFNSGLTAWFEEQNTITIASSIGGVALDFHDPWFYDQTTQSQPDNFRPLSEQGDGNGNVQVFLNQNPNNLSSLPIYRLKAPSVGQVTQNDILVFDGWTVSPAGGATLSNSDAPTTSVVFLNEGVSITANYVSALAAPGKNVNIPSGETVTIPAGGTYLWNTNATGFNFNVSGSLVMNGTAQSPITFGPSTGTSNTIGGIYVENNGNLTMNYVETSYQQYEYSERAIYLEAGEAMITNCRFMNVPKEGIRVDAAASATIQNCEFTGGQSIGSIGIDSDITQGSGNTVTIRNNTIVDFRTGIKTVCTTNGINTTLDMRNNILYYNNTTQTGTICFDHYIEHRLTIDVNYNNSYGFADNFIDNNGQPLTNVYIQDWILDTDPLFNNYAGGDYTLTSTSPVIDEGDPALSDPDGTIADMGAFYFDKVPTAPSGFTILGDVGDHPQLVWDVHEETDVTHYKVYRSLNYGEFILTATVNTSDWTDTEVTINDEKKFSDRACYHVKAVDGINQLSPATSLHCESVDIGLKKQTFVLIPKDYELSSAHPNPFNPTITIPFGLPLNSNVTIGIYNVKGQLVRNIHSSNIIAGFHSVQWNSLTDSGQKVPSGMYIVRLNAVSTDGRKSFQNIQKIALLK